jgi:hypothetical protein
VISAALHVRSPGVSIYARIVARSGAKRLIVGVLGLSIAAACTLFNPLDEYGPPKPRVDAGVDAAPQDGAGESCKHERWPERPPQEDGAENLEIVFALDTLDVGSPGPRSKPNRLTTGFDFDGVCTCPGRSSCVPPPDAGDPCDSDGGVDDKGTETMLKIASLGRLGNDATERFATGDSGLLIRLAQYNGGRNDRQVEASVFLSLGTEPDGNGDPKPPAHDGSDRWTVDRDTLVAASAPPYIPAYVDQNAYVSDGWLTASVTFPLRLNDLVVKLSQAIVVARIERNGSVFRLEDARLAGRWPTATLLPQFDTIKDPFSLDGGGLCGSSLLYADLKRRFCAAVDLAADPQKDNTSAPCDALGVTLLFTAESAQLGSVVDRPPATHLCGDGWTDDCSR